GGGIMLKRIGLSVLGVATLMIGLAAQQAQAAVRFGVRIGPPTYYTYPVSPYSYYPYYSYGYYGYPYYYGSPRYISPYYYGWNTYGWVGRSHHEHREQFERGHHRR